MSQTPERQRTKRGLPFAGSTTPAKKRANNLTKETSTDKISNPDYVVEGMVRKMARPSPGPASRFPAKAQTPTARKTCQRNLKKSSSYCGKNLRNEERTFGSVEKNFASIRDEYRRKNKTSSSASKINLKENSRVKMAASPVSSIGPKHVKTLFKGKKKGEAEPENGYTSLRPQKHLDVCQEIDNRVYDSSTDDMMNMENIKNNYPKPIAEIKPRQTAFLQGSPCLPYKISSSETQMDNYGDRKQNTKASDNIKGNFSVHVAVRVRPFSEREKDISDVHCVVEMYDTSTCITEGNGHSHHFTFDMSYWSFDRKDPTYCDQDNVYESTAQPLLDGVLQGYNTCLFAYGQTGSGKSYSMMGYEDTNAGMIPRFCEELFERIETATNVKFAVEISFFEIYNEKIRDLLSYGQENKKQLRVREHPDHGPYVQDLSLFTVRCYEDIKAWLAVGNKNRATAATGMNDKSSRSHSVFTISLRQSQEEIFEGSDTQLCRTSKVNLIDLAGSEKASYLNNIELSANQEAANSRLKEGSCINKSLHTLGKVISLLSEQQTGSKKKIFVPYRESVLTWLLRESLGGNSRTAMIATISPANIHIAETLSTLRYASQARNIVNQVRVNEDSSSKMIRELLGEIERLKSIQNPCQTEANIDYVSEIEMLRRKLKETTALLTESTRAWEEKLNLSENKQKEEAERLRRSGVAFNVDNSLPNLVNLNEDPMLSEVLVYVLKEGKTTFGNSQSEEDVDIRLDGPLVADYHCYITYELKQVRITPIGDALTFVNGEQVLANSIIRDGDRIVIGGTHYFGFNQPNISKSNKREGRKKWDGLTLKDFEYAKKELTAQQNARLEAELEESQVKAQEGLIDLISNLTATSEKQIYLQKQAYKEKISNLQKLLEEAENKKELAEENQKIAEDKISQMKYDKQGIFEEILHNRKILQVEAKTAKQALEETKANQMEIITELEIEKRRIEDDVKRLKTKKVQREVVRNEIRSALSSINVKDSENKRDLLKIALLLREANKVSEKLGKFITFSRDDILENDKVEIRIRLNDTKLGKTTLWSLDKFEYMVGRMRELYQANGMSEEGAEDPFSSPDDDWVDDFILDSPTTPEPCGRRMSVKKRYSLNHSLNMLTNLNASLSELSTRRRSSHINTNNASTTGQTQELSILGNILEDNASSTDGTSPVCRRLVNIISEIYNECANLEQASQRTSNANSMWKITILVERLKESFSTWSSMNTKMQGGFLDEVRQKIDSLLAALSMDLRTLVKVVQDGSGQLWNSTEGLHKTLQSIVRHLGELSLGFEDSYQQCDKIVLNAEKEPMLYSTFVNGQQSFWNMYTAELAKLIENLKQKLYTLEDNSQSWYHIEKYQNIRQNILSSSALLIQQIQELMVYFFSVIREKNRVVLTQIKMCIQREILRNAKTFTCALEQLIDEVWNTFTKEQSDDSIEDVVENITKELHSVVVNCNCLTARTKSGVDDSVSSNGLDGTSIELDLTLRNIETTAKEIAESIKQYFVSKESISTDLFA